MGEICVIVREGGVSEQWVRPVRVSNIMKLKGMEKLMFPSCFPVTPVLIGLSRISTFTRSALLLCSEIWIPRKYYQPTHMDPAQQPQISISVGSGDDGEAYEGERAFATAP
jgi:hypothetical protein